MIRYFKKTILPFIAASVLASCAHVVAPTGGDVDNIPPKMTGESPPSAKPGFREKKIVISFNEYVSLKDAEEQIVISPPLENKPELEISGKSIVIKLRKPIRENTTYTINFGNAIVDVHEGNVLGDYSYVFATGDAIDTMATAGFVYNGENNSPEKNISVSLYYPDTFTDSTIYRQKPLYFGKTRDNGSFILKNIPDRSFRMIAFNDENKNLRYDKNEPIAFNDTLITTRDSNSMRQVLYLSRPDAYNRNRIIDTFSRETGKFTFLIYKPSQNLQIGPSGAQQHYTWFKAGVNEIDTFVVFTAGNDSDSTHFTINKESFYIRSKKGAKKPAFAMDIKKVPELNDSIRVIFSTPLSKADTSRIIFKRDTTVIRPPKVFTSSNADQWKLAYPWAENTSYSIEYKDSAFMDIYGQYSKRNKLTWTSKNLKNYSTLKLILNYSGSNRNLLAVISDPSEKQVLTSFYIDTKKEFDFEYLTPGTYKVKLIDDRNRNGKWDNGDYFLKRQPERVYYYPDQFSLRAYWDLEQTINVDEIVK